MSQATYCKIFLTHLTFFCFLFFPWSLSHGSTLPIAPTQRPYVINGVKYYPLPTSSGYVESGIASWYGPHFHGRATSNGERYNMHGPTAAHKLLPMNTMLLVKNLENGKETVVRVNDRGPFVRGRIIDLSYGIAKELEIIRKGTAMVRIFALAPEKNGYINDDIDFNFGEFFVQIGSFTVKTNAMRLRKRFTDAGHTVEIQTYNAPEATFYRVHVYVGRHLPHAKRAEQALLDRGYTGAFIVAR